MRSLGGKLAFAASLAIGKHCSDQHLVDAGDFILLRFNHIIGGAAEESFAGCFVKLMSEDQFLFKKIILGNISILIKTN